MLHTYLLKGLCVMSEKKFWYKAFPPTDIAPHILNRISSDKNILLNNYNIFVQNKYFPKINNLKRRTRYSVS